VGWRPRPRPRLELELGVGGIALKWVAPEPLAVVTTAGLPKLALEDMVDDLQARMPSKSKGDETKSFETGKF
jgi:hypothetical protein